MELQYQIAVSCMSLYGGTFEHLKITKNKFRFWGLYIFMLVVYELYYKYSLGALIYLFFLF